VAAAEPVGTRAGADRRPDADSGALAKNSLAVVAWTVVSRTSGFIRVAVVAAVLGPTYLGNIFQATNTLPNLAYAALTGAKSTDAALKDLQTKLEELVK